MRQEIGDLVEQVDPPSGILDPDMDMEDTADQHAPADAGEVLEQALIAGLGVGCWASQSAKGWVERASGTSPWCSATAAMVLRSLQVGPRLGQGLAHPGPDLDLASAGIPG